MVSPRDDADLINRFLVSRDPALREEIILRYVPLVHFVLGRLGLSRSMGADYEDAASQGLLGLIEAIDRFDPNYGAQFSTYATVRVRGRVLDHLRSMDWLSRTARRRARKVQEATNQLWNSLGRAPSDEELSAHLDINLAALQQSLIDSTRVIVSLDTLAEYEGDQDTTLHEMLPDERQVDPSDIFDEQDLKSQLMAALKSLSEREQLVLALYYYEELTLKEIGLVLDVSESRVCQLHARAIMNIKAALQTKTTGEAVSTPEAKSRKEPSDREKRR